MKTAVTTVGRLVVAWACLACGQASVDRSAQDRFFDSDGVPIRYRVWGEEEVRRIRVPVAALIGANDRFVADVRRLSRVLPSTQVTVIPGVDHAAALGHPKFGESLLAFLPKQEGATR